MTRRAGSNIGWMWAARAATAARPAPVTLGGPNGAGLLRGRIVTLAVGLAVAVQGCAGLVGDRESVARHPEPVGEATGSQVARGRPGVVIGIAGSTDNATGRLARDLGRLTGFGVVATAARPGVDEGHDRESRPLSDPGPASQGGAMRGPELFVEMSGGDTDHAGRVEIATVGLSGEEMWRLKTLFELIRDARVDGRSAPRLEVQVEPAAPRSVAAIPPGTAGSTRRALRIDLPPLARTTYREIYTELLGDFLVQSAAFLVPRVR